MKSRTRRKVAYVKPEKRLIYPSVEISPFANVLDAFLRERGGYMRFNEDYSVRLSVKPFIFKCLNEEKLETS